MFSENYSDLSTPRIELWKTLGAAKKNSLEIITNCIANKVGLTSAHLALVTAC